MALITCPECGKEGVSDKAKACPYCGYPVEELYSESTKPDEESAKQTERDYHLYFNDGSGAGTITREVYRQLDIIDEYLLSGTSLVRDADTYYVINRRDMFVCASSTNKKRAEELYNDIALASTP